MVTESQPQNATEKQKRHALELYERDRPKDPAGDSCVMCQHPFGVTNLLKKDPNAHHYYRKCPQCGFKNST